MLEPLCAANQRKVFLRSATVSVCCVATALLITFFCRLALGRAEGHADYVLAAVIPTVLSLPICVWLFTRIEQVHRAYERLELIASTDELTQCLNRRAFTAAAKKIDNVLGPTAFLIIDVDHFKLINDNFGHQVGDEVLCKLAGTIQASVQNCKLVGRLGGEEFGVLLPQTSKEKALAVAEGLRQDIQNLHFAPHGSRHLLSVSVGVSIAYSSFSFESEFSNADTGLYHAKNSGRNCVRLGLRDLAV